MPGFRLVHEASCGAACALAASTDGTHFAAIFDKCHDVCVWKTNSHNPDLRLKGHTRNVEAIAYSPTEDHMLVSGCQGSVVLLWDTRRGSSGPLQSLQGELKSGVRSLAWEPDGKFIAIGFDDGSVYRWDMGSAEVEKLADPLEAAASKSADPILFLSFCNHQITQDTFDNLLLIGTNSLARIWDLKLGKERVSFKHDGAKMLMMSLMCFSTRRVEHNRVLTVGDDNTARTWDPDNGNELARLPSVALNHSTSLPADRLGSVPMGMVLTRSLTQIRAGRVPTSTHTRGSTTRGLRVRTNPRVHMGIPVLYHYVQLHTIYSYTDIAKIYILH